MQIETLLDHEHAVVQTKTVPVGAYSMFQSIPHAKVIICLSGNGIAADGVRNVKLVSGKSVAIQPHELHRVKNTGDNPLVVLEVTYNVLFGYETHTG